MKSHYWYMWKPAMVRGRNVDRIMIELTGCRNASRGHHIRMIGYDGKRPNQGLTMLVYCGDALLLFRPSSVKWRD